jgi:uncharacterized membrane protein
VGEPAWQDFQDPLDSVVKLGAIGLLVPQVAAVAAYALGALLVAMFPANVRAARAGLVVVGRRATPLIWRLPLQLFWIAALLWIARASASASSAF